MYKKLSAFRFIQILVILCCVLVLATCTSCKAIWSIAWQEVEIPHIGTMKIPNNWTFQIIEDGTVVITEGGSLAEGGTVVMRSIPKESSKHYYHNYIQYADRAFPGYTYKRTISSEFNSSLGIGWKKLEYISDYDQSAAIIYLITFNFSGTYCLFSAPNALNDFTTKTIASTALRNASAWILD